MNNEDRELIKDLIASLRTLTTAINQMPRSITAYPAPGYGAGGYHGAGGGYASAGGAGGPADYSASGGR